MMGKTEIFLLDSDSFITPYRLYYAFDLVPAYWSAISRHINSGKIVVLDMVKDEIDKGKDELSAWITEMENLIVVSHENVETISKYQEIIQYIATCGLYKESALHNWARNNIADPWLIASSAVNGYTLITEEVGSGGLSPKNLNKMAKIPDVAKHFGVKTENIYQMMRKLNIRIE